MPQTLSSLESRRSLLLEEISQLGDFRSGSVSAVVRRCGKSNCHCARPQDPGHGPHLRLTYKRKGKTVTETPPHPAAWRKAQREMAQFRKFQALVRALVEVNAQIRSLRSSPSPTPQAAQLLRREADYFGTNAERMRYPAFRSQHLFVGSGVIEAGCKTLAGSRLKRSAMFWTVRGAHAVLALRCNRLSGQFENYGESRRPSPA
jgi:hypothetical protein